MLAMRAGIAAALPLLLAACGSTAQSNNRYEFAPGAGEIAPKATPPDETVAKINGLWDQCLGRAFGNARTQTGDKNEAAERALANCASGERLIMSYFTQRSVDPTLLAVLRLRKKQQLIQLP
jgi:hypothetical protein